MKRTLALIIVIVLTGCGEIPPYTMGSLSHASLPQRKAEFQRQAIAVSPNLGLWENKHWITDQKNYFANDPLVLNDPTQDHIRNARLGSISLGVSGIILYAYSFIAPIYSPLGLAALGGSVWPQSMIPSGYFKLAQDHNEALRNDLQLNPSEAIVPEAPRMFRNQTGASAYYLNIGIGFEVLSNASTVNLYSTPSQKINYWQPYETPSDISLETGWVHPSGLTLELGFTEPASLSYGVNWLGASGNVDLQDSILASDIQTVAGLGWTLQTWPKNSWLLLSWQAGWMHATLNRSFYSASNQFQSDYTLSSDSFVQGPLLRWCFGRDSLFMERATCLELGYRFAKANQFFLTKSSGTLPSWLHQPEDNSSSQPVSWDFSGAFVRLVFMIGKLPFQKG